MSLAFVYVLFETVSMQFPQTFSSHCHRSLPKFRNMRGFFTSKKLIFIPVRLPSCRQLYFLLRPTVLISLCSFRLN